MARALARTRGMRTVGIAVLAFIALLIVFSSYTIISPGHRGVVVFLGSVEANNVLGEGFHLVIPPLARQVVEVDVRTKKLEMLADAASRDLQAVSIVGVLNYHLNPSSVGLLYQEVGLDYESIIIVPAMQEAIKAATALYRVEDILSRRAEIKAAIQGALTERLAATHIVVDEFSIANAEFSAEFNQAIERKQIAEQAAQQKQYELQAAQKDIEIAAARAEAEKAAAIKAAEGRAQARALEAEAEAAALALIAEQLRDNPALIQYEWANKLAPGVNTVLLPANQELILSADALLGPNQSQPAARPQAQAEPQVTPVPQP